MDGLLLVIILIGILIVVYFDSFQKICETFVDAISIRRWRDPAPVGISPNIVSRQVSDDWWAQQYNSGIGFQLG
jgi:hypothetical protein